MLVGMSTLLLILQVCLEIFDTDKYQEFYQWLYLCRQDFWGLGFFGVGVGVGVGVGLCYVMLCT